MLRLAKEGCQKQFKKLLDKPSKAEYNILINFKKNTKFKKQRQSGQGSMPMSNSHQSTPTQPTLRSDATSQKRRHQRNPMLIIGVAQSEVLMPTSIKPIVMIKTVHDGTGSREEVAFLPSSQPQCIIYAVRQARLSIKPLTSQSIKPTGLCSITVVKQ